MLKDDSPLSDLVRVWHAPIGRAVLAAMNMPQELVDAVDDPELYGGVWPTPDCIPDLIFVANLIAETPNPFSPEPGGSSPRPRQGGHPFGLDEERLAEVLAESEERQALMTTCSTWSDFARGRQTKQPAGRRLFACGPEARGWSEGLASELFVGFHVLGGGALDDFGGQLGAGATLPQVGVSR